MSIRKYYPRYYLEQFLLIKNNNLKASKMDSKPSFSFYRKPLTVQFTKTFCPTRGDKKANNDDENIPQKVDVISMAPKSFYPVRVEPKRRPALMPVTPRAFYQAKTIKKTTATSSKSPKLGQRFGAAKKKKSVKPKPPKQLKQPKTKSPKARYVFE